MSLAERCRNEFESQVRSRGHQYFWDGHVQLGKAEDNAVQAVVIGTSEYRVLLDWSDASQGMLQASCTCPYYEDRGPCKHLWATILASDAAGIGPSKGSRRLEIVDIDDGDDDDDDDDFNNWDDEDDPDEDFDDEPEDEGIEQPGSLLSVGGNWPGFLPPQSRKSRSPHGKANWRQQLTRVFDSPTNSGAGDRGPVPPAKRREVWYVLDIAQTKKQGVPVIKLFQRETRLTGQFGKLKSLGITSSDLVRFSSPEDRDLLQLLLAGSQAATTTFASYGYHNYRYHHYGYQPKVSEVPLLRGAYDHVLPKLAATGRLRWLYDSGRQDAEQDGRPLAWDDGLPWRFALRVEPNDQAKRWRLEGQLLREGEEPVTLTTPVLLLSSGLVVFEDRLARLEVGDGFSWIVALREHPAIEIPYRDRWKLLTQLWQLPSHPEGVLPANLRGDEVRLPPQGRLTVASPERHARGRLYGKVAFGYDTEQAAIEDPSTGIVDTEGKRILIRDREKERELLAFLFAQGVRPVEDSYSPRHDVWLSQQDFPAAVDRLVQAGWLVEAQGHRYRKAGEFRMTVTSQVDWFDLEGTCDFEGQAVALPKLLEALHHGQDHVRLGDGSYGLLPQAWLKKFAPLVETGQAEADRIRFRPSQAMLLDALLAAQDQEASVDRQFDTLRRKLRSFEGVAPREEPRGFHGQLREYQKEGLGWLEFLREFRLGGCLADDMGLGKTIQVLALLQARRRQARNGSRAPSLVVVPRSLVFNWIEETRRFAPGLRVLDYTGTLRKGSLHTIAEHDLVVTTYGTLQRDIAALKDVRFDYAILDEAQAIKNAHSQRAKTCRLLQAEHRLVMTGTPVENHLGELWSLFEYLNPGMLGKSSVFREVAKTASSDDGNLPLLRRALAPFMLRRTKEQVLAELPQKTEQTLYCDLEGKQRKRYQELRDHYRASLTERIAKTGLAKAKIHVLEALLRLRQAACHPGLLDHAGRDESSAKLDVLLEQLAEVIAEGHKALVFSQFTSFLAIVRRHLDREKIVYEYLDGRTRDRRQRVERFQSDAACPLFLISLKAGGHGLNLTAADYVFLLDPWWNPAVEAQAIDRVHRIGQARRVFAYRLIARDTVEEKILELQKTKRDLADAIISADRGVLQSLTADDLSLLFS